MGKVDIPYYVVVKGRGYWRPKPDMQKLGFQRVKCGADGPAAWKIAKGWNERWQRVRRGEEKPPIAVIGGKIDPEIAEDALIYPPGTFGGGFKEFRRTGVWKKKKPRTREDWWRAWKHIKAVFGDVRPRDVTLGDISDLRDAIAETISIREAHRVIKIWRAMWGALAALRYCHPDEDPSLGMANEAAKGRTQTWTEGEVVRLVKHAWRTNRRGLAGALAVLWDSQLSPVDVRTLTAGQTAISGRGSLFFTERGKTDVAVCGALSRRATALVDAYVAGLGFDLHEDAPIFRMEGTKTSAKGGRPWAPRPFTKDGFGKAFRELRSEVFGEDEKRQMIDFRRSGAVEAVIGGATREDLGKAMGNGIAKSDELFDTYAPVNSAMLTAFQKKRQKGRQALRENEEGGKVPTRRLGQSQLGASVAAKSLK